MIIKYNNHLLYSDIYEDTVYFYLCQQSFFIIKIDYFFEEFQVLFSKTLSEYLNNLFSFFMRYYIDYKKFELYCYDIKNYNSNSFIHFNKELYVNLAELLEKKYYDNQI